MIELFFALLMAMSCPAHKHNTSNGNTPVVTQDLGGDTGHIPPGSPPPTPPAPPTPPGS